ncbi:hypothetical protein Tco_0679080 [Tanacetum coccineum]|uniref:Uncharacterized protein n=1 Tax=Tanacetum coccineum TaxID=301880 RepID=A0ABQ4XI73_9ASTR
MAGSDDDIPPPPPPPQTQTPTQQTPHTVSTIKLPILKKGEYDIWAMKMEHYLAHTDYPIWEVIQRGNGPVSVSTDTNGVIKVLPPKTAEEILARERERKARTTLLMALPEDHLAKFHKMTDAKEMWEAIKSRFGGNDESKKMQKYILKQQFEGFSVSNSEGLHKGYDRFQSLLSQLEIHGAGVSTEDANQKFLRSLPSAWSQVSLIMRTKPGVDSLSFDDLYNNLRVFESDVKGSTASSSSTQNVAFVSENTSSTNDVSTAYGVSNSSGHNSQCEHPSSYSFLANQSSCPQLDHEDLEQLDEFDLEEMDLKWQVAMISMRMKKFYKKTGRKLQFDAKEKSSATIVTRQGILLESADPRGIKIVGGEMLGTLGIKIKTIGGDLSSAQDNQREQLGDASIEIHAYTQALKKVEAQLVTHQQNQLWYEEKIKFMKIDLDDKTDVLTYHKKLLAEAEKEKEELKAKMSAMDKVGLGSSDIEEGLVNDRYAEGMHVVPPPMTEIYIPSGPDKEIDDSQFTYGPKQSLKTYFSHLIRDCDFHEKRMAKQAEVNKRKCKGTGQRENRPVWNNVNRVNHQNQFVPTAVLTRTGKIQVNTARASSTNNVNTVRASSTKDVSTARHNFNSQAVPTNAARKVNTVKPIVNNVRPKTVFHKTYSPIRRPFNRTTTSRTNFSNQKVNTAEDYPQRALKNKGIVDSGCSRHMTGNKAHLAEYQDYNGGPVAFGGSKGYITGKVSHICDKKNKFSSQTLNLKNVPVPLDHFPINALTSKVLSFMVKKGKNFSGNVTPLFDSMLVQPTEDEGEASERPSESQPIPSPPHPSEDQPKSQPDPSLRPSPSIPIPDSNPEGSGGNHGGQSSSDRSLSGNEDGLTLQSVYDLCISLCKQVIIQAKEIKDLKAHIKKLKKKARPMITHHKAWMKSGRKTAKSKTTAHKDQAFDDLDDFGAMDYMETEDAHNEKGVSTKDQVSTVKPDEGTDRPKVSTDKIDEGTTELKNGNSDKNATPTATLTVFGDDETIAEFLARIKDDSILAARLQEKEREKFTIEERAKLLHDTIAAQRRFLTQQRAAEIRSRPPTRTQLRNQMMTYLKHVRGKKHSDLKTKNFEEIQVLYEKVKMSDENFIAIGSAEDERRIKDVNKKATGIKKDDNIKEESKEKESTRKRKHGTRKKMKSRKRIFRQDASQDDQTDSEKENDKLRLCLTIATDEDKEVDYEILDKKYPIIEWKTEYLGTKPQFDKTKRLEEINLNVVIRGNGQRRYFSTLMRVLSIFDREDINAVYQLVMDSSR